MHGTQIAKPAPAQIEKIRLTPKLAMTLLEGNGMNRPLRDGHVKRIAAQISGGRWRFNGDTIKISKRGDVLDGQHRLWAVIEANTPVDTVIVRGVDRDAFATIDTIRAVRTGGDVLALNGASRYRNQISSALQWLIRYQRGVVPTYRDPKNRVENSDIEAAWTAHPGMEDAVERATKLRGIANPSIIGFLYYVMSNRDAETADRMMETLANPISVPIEDPFYVLRAYFLGEHHKRKDPLMSIALTIKAANAAKAGKPMRRLAWRASGTGAEAFPQIGF